MKSVGKCPNCGGEIVIKEVDKLLRGGKHTAILKVSAEVCLSSGKRLYSVETVRKFAKIRQQLQREETQDFQPMGQFFRVG